MPVWLWVAFGLSWLPAARAAAAQEAPKPEIKPAVVSGERLVHNLQDRKPQSVVVKVVGADGHPVSGAMVVFQLPPGATVPTGAFLEEGTSEERIILTTVTDAQGNAVARGLRPNATPGKWEVSVQVAHQGTTTTFQITQINQEACKPGYRPAVPPTGYCVKPGGSGKWIALAVVGAGGAAGAALGLRGKGGAGGGTPQQQQPPPPISGTIRLGTVTVVPPTP